MKIYRQLAEARPDSFLPGLAASLNNQSNRLVELGRAEEALTAIQEAVSIRRQLAEAHPDAFLPGLRASLYDLAKVLSILDRDTEASAIREEADAVVGLSTQESLGSTDLEATMHSSDP